MVPRYDVSMRVRHGGAVVDTSLEFCRSAMVGDFAGVDQDVTIWDVTGIERMGV